MGSCLPPVSDRGIQRYSVYSSYPVVQSELLFIEVISRHIHVVTHTCWAGLFQAGLRFRFLGKSPPTSPLGQP